MDYIETVIRQDIEIKKIVTVHYFEYTKNYVFDGEKHNFWELLYVDKGEVEVMADITGYKLKQGEMIFHKPNEFHKIWANGTVAPNLVVISFVCKSRAMSFFQDKILQVSDYEKDILGEIISEAKNLYMSSLDDPLLKKLKKHATPLFGSEQLIEIYLEQMLIQLIRKGTNLKKVTKISTTTKQRSDSDLIDKVIEFLRDNLYNNITFDNVCKYSNQSRTNLKVLFKSETGMGIMEYYRNLKIKEIKKIIREKTLNFTKISETLGYTSVHYFSRHFKQVTGMTPSEYAASVKAKVST